MVLLPDGLSVWVQISFSHIHEEGVCIYWYHEFFVEINHCEPRVDPVWLVVSHCCAGACDEVESDRTLWLIDGGYNLDIFPVSMSKSGEPHYVLKSLHQSLIPDSKLVEALVRRNVGHDMCETTIFFKLGELFLQPSKLVARIVSVVHKPPIEIVARLHIYCDHFSFCVKR